MGRMKRMRKRQKQIPMRPLKPATWAGEPNARELELEREIKRIEARFAGKAYEELPKDVQADYGRLHCELLMESQKRSGFEFIKITPNAAGDGATYDGSNFFQIVKAAQMLIDAGIPRQNAIARAIDDERWRQQQGDAEAGAEQSRGFMRKIKDIFRSNN